MKVMLALVGAVVLVAAVSLLTTLLVVDGGAARTLPGDLVPAGITENRLLELERRIGQLEGAIEGLRRAEPVRSALPVVRPTVADLETTLAPSEAPRPSAGATPLDPRQLLAEYVSSFANGGKGSEFFRMAVAAYAWLLRRDLTIIVLDGGAVEELRLQVIAMLDGGSFRGDGETIDTLLDLLRTGGFEAGELKALEVLRNIGDQRTAQLLEGLAIGIDPLHVRGEVYAAIAELAGSGADAALLRLFERERDPDGRLRLLALLRGSDLAATRRLFELASRQELEIRLDAASRIGHFHDDSIARLIDEWYGREPEEAVRQRLKAALDEQRSVPSWHELQATGAPDVANLSEDNPHAWASAAADGGHEWLELTFPPRRANRVTIYETCVPGAVVTVALLDAAGTSIRVFEGDDPTTVAGPFVVRFGPTAQAIEKVRIEFDTKRRPGWNEIDAVELGGPDGAVWATHASASSRYGQSRQPWSASSQALGLFDNNFQDALRRRK